MTQPIHTIAEDEEPVKPLLRPFHYNYNKPASLSRGEPLISVHYLGRCHIVRSLKCLVPCESKISKRSPRVVMRGKAASLKVRAMAAIIS